MSQHNSNNIVNKVIYNGETLIDLSVDTVTQAQVLSPAYVHLPDGTRVQGSCTYDSNTTDATAQASEILSGETAYVNANKITGSMPNIGAQNASISTVAQEVTISQGYHDGSGKVKIDTTEQAKIVSGNIKTGVEILGVTGTYTGTEIAQAHATTGSATPTGSSQTILPSSYNVNQDDDFQYFTQFTVAAIPYVEAINAAGGYTATIGTAPSGS